MVCTHIQRLHASATTEVATAIAMTQMETSDAPVIMAINLTVMDKHVKVCNFIITDCTNPAIFNFSLIVMHYKLQISMSVLQALICVIPEQHATTFKEVTHALATQDTQAMAFFA